MGAGAGKPPPAAGSGVRHAKVRVKVNSVTPFSGVLGLSIAAKGGKAHVTVRNVGDTIPPEELAMIFQHQKGAEKPHPWPGLPPGPGRLRGGGERGVLRCRVSHDI